MKKLVIIIFFSVSSSLLFCQTSDSTFYDYRVHYTIDRGKWTGSGEINYSKDSTIVYRGEAVYGENANVFYLYREWFYPNGRTKRKIFVDFKKPYIARVIDRAHSENGKLIQSIRKKAKRKPEQNSFDKVDWDKK